jgi:hypothetical protein
MKTGHRSSFLTFRGIVNRKRFVLSIEHADYLIDRPRKTARIEAGKL